MSFINFARVLLAALEQGRDATSGQIFLPQEQALSKGNFADFEQVMAAWDRQIRYYTRKSIEIECVVDSVLEENAHDILCSALVDDCIERGKSIKQGGAKYDWVSGLQVGIANTGNSLAAVRKLVFDQGRSASSSWRRRWPKTSPGWMASSCVSGCLTLRPNTATMWTRSIGCWCAPTKPTSKN